MFFDLRSVPIEQRLSQFRSEITFVTIRVSTITEWCLQSSFYAIWFRFTVDLLFIVLNILKKVIGVVILVNLPLFLVLFHFWKFFDLFFGVFLLVLWISIHGWIWGFWYRVDFKDRERLLLFCTCFEIFDIWIYKRRRLRYAYWLFN